MKSKLNISNLVMSKLSFSIFFILLFNSFSLIGQNKLTDPRFVISISAVSDPKQYVMINEFVAELNIISSDKDKENAKFYLRSGLDENENCYSLESVKHPSYFLRVIDGILVLNKIEESELFQSEASFIFAEGLDKESVSYSIESLKNPGFYLKRDNQNLRFSKKEDTESYSRNASFLLYVNFIKDFKTSTNKF